MFLISILGHRQWHLANSKVALYLRCRSLGLGLPLVEALCPPPQPPRPAWAHFSLPGQHIQSRQQDKLPLLVQGLQLPCVA